MVANALLLLVTGLVVLALSAIPALFGGDLSPTLLVISFAWGVFMGALMLRHHGSAAAVWRYWRERPG